MARILNDFFVTVCGADDRFVNECSVLVTATCVFFSLVDNHSLIAVLCAVAHSAQKIDNQNDSRNYSTVKYIPKLA